MKNNYHTHMYLCRHAVGDVEDYVRQAIKLGFKALGMSDHAPFPELADRSVRMYLEDYKTYLAQCDYAIKKYKDQIKVYKALEIEYFPKHKEMYETLLGELDYLALGQHYIHDVTQPGELRSTYRLTTHQHIETYVDTLIEAMATGYFKFICHPDLMLYGIDDFTEAISKESKRLIQAAINYDIPLEINANGIRKGLKETKNGMRYLYPRKEFWELVKAANARVIISSDAHQPSHLYNHDVIKTYEFASQLGIEVEEALSIELNEHRR